MGQQEICRDQGIYEICTVLEKAGAMGVSGLHFALPHIERSRISKFCTRAVLLGLATAEMHEFRRTFTIVDGWQNISNADRPKRKPEQALAWESPWSGVSSVFRLGSV